MLLASASGARTWAGVAGLEPRSVVSLFAAGELVVDKLPNIQPRIAAPSLVGRVVAGALIGAVVARRAGGNAFATAAVGGLAGFVSAHATYHLRRALMERLPALEAALVEDAMVVAVAVLGAVFLRASSRDHHRAST